MTHTEPTQNVAAAPIDGWMTWSVVDPHKRLDFLPEHFPITPVAMQNLIFIVAEKTITGYNGGYWEFATSEHGWAFVYPKSGQQGDEDLEVFNLARDNCRTLHPVLAGIHTTMLALLQIMQEYERLNLTDRACERLQDHYFAMRDYGMEVSKRIGQERDFFQLIN